jgi:glycerol-3-phosphate dehydrogenase
MSRKEREILQRIAPNLVKPLPLAILFYKGDPYPLVGIQAAAYYYNYLSKTDKAEKSKVIRDSQKIQHLLGPIATDTLKGCVVIWDSTTDDARLTLAALKDAHQHGAVITNYVRFLNFVNQPDTTDSGNCISKITAEDVISGQRFEISARKVVSATGSWSDEVWRKDPSYDGMPRLVTKNAQGIHIVLPRCGKEDTSGAYGLVISTQSEVRQGGKSRGIFILPGPHNTSIVGTTETTPEEDLSSVRASADEVTYLLSETQRIFPEQTLNNDAIIATYAGTRPLIAENQHRQEFFQNKRSTTMLLSLLTQAHVHS